VHPGWIIESVDGKSTRELVRSLGEESLIPDIVEQWFSGPPNSTVNVSFTASGKTVVRSIERETPPGELAQFGNLPPERIRIEHRKLEDGVGYIRLNLFLDPLLVMPEIEKAIEEFRSAPGIVLDLRNNPGGMAAMAMGISGWFVAKDGLRLGTMTSRDSTVNFIVNPRLHPYQGRLAILVNAGSASTSEILAQGLRDLGRARIFGTRSAGAALPSNIIELPNGDRFQYPVASYVSMKGKALEGNGVTPDVVVAATIPALLEGRDLPLEAARSWSRQK
jgi:carboxyl-terminal processing protease